MKKVFIGVGALLMMSSVCMAGLLTDYSAGKVAIDVSTRHKIRI